MRVRSKRAYQTWPWVGEGMVVVCSLCLWAALGSTRLWAQPVRQLEMGIERDVNRYRWEAGFTYAQQWHGWDLDVRNLFTSDAFVLFDDRLSFQDENQLRWQATRALAPGLSGRLHGHGAWFSQSRVLSQDLYAGLRLQPRPYAWFEPAVGAALDQRPGAVGAAGTAPLRTDAGPAFGARFALAPPLDAARLQVHGEGAWLLITPRRGALLRLESAFERAFEATRLTATLGLASLRRDAYQSVSFLNRDVPAAERPESIEATTSDTLVAGLAFDAPFYRRFRLNARVDVEATNRFVRTLRAPAEALFFDTDFNRRSIDFDVGVGYERPGWLARLAVRTGAEVEQRRLDNRDALPPAQASQKSDLLQQADYDRGHVALQARGRATLARRLILSFDGTASILRHDTPDVNPDDRDEVFHRAQLGLLLPLSRYLQVDVTTFGTFYHTVYLNASRSAENNVQRSLRLRPTLRWTPSERTRARLSSEVRATYTVDDFVLAGRRPKDQSARELRYDAALEQTLAAGLRFFAEGAFSTLHLGRLMWDDFAEIPFDTLRTYSGWIHLQVGERLLADVGLRFFVRRDYDRAVTVRYARVDEAGAVLRDEAGRVLYTSIARPGQTRIGQAGPTCALTWPMRRGAALRLDGWLNVQHVRQRLYGALPEGAADRIRRAARRGARKVIPNLALTMVWTF